LILGAFDTQHPFAYKVLYTPYSSMFHKRVQEQSYSLTAPENMPQGVLPQCVAGFQPSWVFDEGDVEFVITPDYAIRVDSAILKSASRFFRASLSATWAGWDEGDHNIDSDERSVKWTYILELDEGDAEGDIFKRQVGTASSIDCTIH
jgi:hypothetical protein